ncbi:MAG: hypothetical protein WC635_10085 [Bacteriovorax sp.]|jgi:hypothetical protein
MDIFAFFKSAHFSRIDRILVNLSLLSSLIFLYFLFRHKEDAFQRDLRPIARLESEGNALRRKMANSLNWSDISNNSVIFQADEIFNDKDSFAKIYFINKKNIITLPPNTLISVEEKEEKTTLEVKEGQIEVALAKNEKIDIKNGSASFQIASNDNAKATISNAAGEVSVSASEGSVQLEKGSKKTEIKTDQVVVVKQDKTKEIELKKIRIIYPINNQEINISKETMRVEAADKIQGKIIVAMDREFSKIVLEKEANNISLIHIDELEEGNYFLKIQDKDNQSEIRFFKVTNPLEFGTLSPLEDETVVLNSTTDPVKLSWQPVPEGAVVEIEIDNPENATGKSPIVINHSEKNNYANITGLRGKLFAWKARIHFRGKTSKYSETNNVKIAFSMPMIVEKEAPAEFNSYEAHSIKWKRRSADEAFRVTLTKDNVKTDEITQDNQWNFNNLKNGIYDLEISSLLFPGVNNSIKRKLTVLNPIFLWESKPVQSVYYSSSPDLILNLKIKKLDSEAIRFTLRSQSSKAEKEILLDAKSRLKIKGYGDYCISGKGRPDAHFIKTDEYCFKFIESKKIILSDQEENQVMKPVGGKRIAYQVQVPENGDAVKYEFVIFSDKAGKNKVFQTSGIEPGFVWESDLSGIYYLKYRVTDKFKEKSDYSVMSQIMFPLSPYSEWAFGDDTNKSKLKSKYASFEYIPEAYDSLLSVLKRFSKTGLIAYKNSPIVMKLKKFNPKISKWNELDPSEKLILYIPEEFLDLEKYKDYQAKRLQELTKFEENLVSSQKSALPPRKESRSSYFKDAEDDLIMKLDKAIDDRYVELNSFVEKLRQDKMAAAQKIKLEREAAAQKLKFEKEEPERRRKAALNELLKKKKALLDELARKKQVEEEEASIAISKIDTFGVYRSVKGDTFESISMLIYGNSGRATELRKLNHFDSKTTSPADGTRLIYVKK